MVKIVMGKRFCGLSSVGLVEHTWSSGCPGGRGRGRWWSV